MNADTYRRIAAPALVKEFVTERRGVNLVRHQLESFNEFVLHRVPAIISACNNVDINNEWVADIRLHRHKLSIRVDNPRLVRPAGVEKDGSSSVMTPQEARLRGISYSAALHVDVHITAKSVVGCDPLEVRSDDKTLLNVCLGKIPIMVKSKYCITNSMPVAGMGDCRHDFGGYFIINGNEKVVISNDRMAENQTFVFANNKPNLSFSHTAEIRSVAWSNDGGAGTVKSLVLRASARQNQFGRYIRVALPHAKQDVPVMLLFRAFGVESDRDVVNLVACCATEQENAVLRNQLMGSLAEGCEVRCSRDALESLMRAMNCCDSSEGGGDPNNSAQCSSKLDYVRTVVSRDILPHAGRCFASKALYLGYMIRRLLRCVLGLDDPDDRDSYVNKRVDTPGVMMASLFRVHYVRMIKEMRNSISREIAGGAWKPSGGFINVINKVNIGKHIKSSIIESGMKYALATGNWNVKGILTLSNSKVLSRKQGVAQVLNRLTYVATLSHLRRINTPMEKNGKMVQPRKLHNSQWGIICPAETPEGASVGLVKNLALTAGISTHAEPWMVIHRMRLMGLGAPSAAGSTPVMVNGRIVGSHPDAAALVKHLRELKRQGVINVFTSVVLDVRGQMVVVNTEGGRFVRPLLVVDGSRQRLALTLEDVLELRAGRKRWWQLVFEGKMEYLDVPEMNVSMVAMRFEDLCKGARGVLRAFAYTHMEIDPACIMGALTSCIPFSDHNQAPRNTYQSAMGKQAIGVNVSNFNHRFDTVNHILHYPQRALVETRVARLLRSDKLPSGVNALVAIMTFTGYNQEDSVLINRAAVQRGMFVSTMYKTFREQNNRNHANGEEEFFCKPNPAATRNMKPCNYGKLNQDGFVPEDTMIQEGDIIIGKCMPQKVGAELIYRDSSVPYKGSDTAFVDRNCHEDNYFTTVNGDGYTFAKTRVRCVMEPVIGDKFSSRHAQKGTCGMILDEWDLPWTADGVVPDVIMNSHAIPSRMTIAQLLEGVVAKAACVHGSHGHGSAFQVGDFESVGDVLEEAGLQRCGDEVMYDPFGGRQMDVDVFLTPTFYQRLKHLSSQKVHSRGANGPVVLLTRQPTEGRSREGALRQGNMETHVLVTHGCMQFLKERLMECSDNFRVFVCNSCGFMADVNREQGMYSCRGCKQVAVSFSEVRMPYSCKLLLQEIHSLNVGVRFKTG
jgi:DNA-directed RNA polymerase II subunit RPB2